VETTVVNPRLLAEVKRMRAPGQRLVMKSATEVWLVNNGAAG
jgi:hypothetical protein